MCIRDRDNMFRASSILLQDGENVLQRLCELAAEAVRREEFLFVPADDASSEDHSAARADAIGIAFGAGPASWQKGLHWPCSFNRSRAMIIRWTSLAPS